MPVVIEPGDPALGKGFDRSYRDRSFVDFHFNYSRFCEQSPLVLISILINNLKSAQAPKLADCLFIVVLSVIYASVFGLGSSLGHHPFTGRFSARVILYRMFDTAFDRTFADFGHQLHIDVV